MSQPPTFQELLDWVDGVLDEEHSADVTARASAHAAEVEDSLTWIREFRESAALMPLQEPPPEVGAAARQAFRQLRTPWLGGDDATRLDLTHDSRTAPLAGVRAGQSSATADVHLELRGPGVSVSLDVTTGGSAGLTITGVVTIDPAASDEAESAVAVVLSSGPTELRTAAVDSDGHFAAAVEESFDRLDVVTSERRLGVSITSIGRA